jgi:hypothetical protein
LQKVDAEGSKDEAFKMRVTFYAHMLASLSSTVDHDSGTTEVMVNLAKFSPQWIAFLKGKDKANRVTVLQGLIRTHSSAYTSRVFQPLGHSSLPFAERTLDLFDGPFVNALHHPHYLSSMADVDTHGKHYLLCVSFAPPSLANDSATKQRRAAQLEAARLRESGVAASLITPEPTDILLHSKVAMPNEILGNLGNVELVFGAAVADAYNGETPAVLKSLQLIASHLTHEGGSGGWPSFW